MSAGASRKFIGEECHFKGRYSPNVLNTVFNAYRPFLGRILSLLVIGFLGRLLMVFRNSKGVEVLVKEPSMLSPFVAVADEGHASLPSDP